MIIQHEKVEVVITNQGKYYRKIGYHFNKQGDKILVDWKDLPKNSQKKLKYRCDDCGKEAIRQFQLLTRQEIHRCRPCNRKYIGKTMDRTNIDIATKSRVGELHPRWNKNKTEFKKYCNKVRLLTERIYKENLNILNPHGLKRTLCGVEDGYQLDHKISVKFGFENNISPEELSKVSNLQLIPWKENRDKWYHINIQ